MALAAAALCAGGGGGLLLGRGPTPQQQQPAALALDGRPPPPAAAAACRRYQPPLALLRLAHADAAGRGSGVEDGSSTKTTTTTSVAAPATAVDDDTITGVFHRLDTSRAKLRLVQVVFRHGARTPLTSKRELWKGVAWDVCGRAYPAMPVRLYSTSGEADPPCPGNIKQLATVYEGGCHKGELTLVGQGQALGLGRWLRARYVEKYGLLPPRLQDGVLAARTTNYSRTVATLAGVLTGLYPHDAAARAGAREEAEAAAAAAGRGEGRAQEGLPPAAAAAAAAYAYASLAAMAVTTSQDLDEILFADTKACPHLGSFLRLARDASREAVVSDPDYAWARGQLAQLMGIDAAMVEAERWIWCDVHDVLTSLTAHGKPLPAGVAEQPRLLQAIDRLATKELAAYVAPSVKDQHGRAVLRLSMGRLLHMLLANMREAAAAASEQQGQQQGAQGQPPPLLRLYSGHDSTIMPLLAALGMDVESWPPYVSNLTFELWELPPPHQPAAAEGQEQLQGLGTEAAEAGRGAPLPGPGRFLVRVLYNKQEVALPLCPPGFCTSLGTFEEQVLAPFILSQRDYKEACALSVGHDGAMPRPQQQPAGASPTP